MIHRDKPQGSFLKRNDRRGFLQGALKILKSKQDCTISSYSENEVIVNFFMFVEFFYFKFNIFLKLRKAVFVYIKGGVERLKDSIALIIVCTSLFG
jgi:hypothetical protein